ncbi:hypothetical protein AK812_SmicGene15523 [Symbiodinium microadriaticum]|uniref:Uncharacterized protein n=1 Tax=Symbiodinium microadriaticum TaxID=2951 RepID=A0A1Q9E2R5_SYMMI|nr:hypothetical protein AK812_SmicGene15523 [Symbiodinium microadriaticum]
MQDNARIIAGSFERCTEKQCSATQEYRARDLRKLQYEAAHFMEEVVGAVKDSRVNLNSQDLSNILQVLSAKSASKMFELTPQALANAAQWWGTLSARSLTPVGSAVATGLASRDPHPSQEAASLVWCIAVPDAIGPRAEQRSAASHGSARWHHLTASRPFEEMSKDAADPGEHYAFLLKKCVKVVETYDPKKTTIDAYMEDAPFLKDKKLGDTELKFIHQVFYGCMRYHKFLKLFITSFMYKCPAAALRAEQNIYLVLAYLLFFRLEELTVPELRQFLLCGYGAAPAINALMQYALSVEELEKWVKVEWCKFYDVDYVEQDIIGKLQSFKDELQTTSDEVEFRATGTVKAADGTALIAKSEKKLTEFKPFNLTRPRGRQD